MEMEMTGYEHRCEELIAKELKIMAGYKYIESDSGFNNPTLAASYNLRIPRPLSFETVRNRLSGKHKLGKYKLLNDFSLDVRTIFGNFTRYNYSAQSARLRRDVHRVYHKFEQCWFELLSDILKNQPVANDKLYLIPQPLKELKQCLAAFDDIVKLPQFSIADSKTYAMDSFIDPVNILFPPDLLKEYLNVVKKPMCYSDIISKLFQCEYESLTSLYDDIDLLVRNCSIYWSQESIANPDAKLYIQDAMTLQTHFIKGVKHHTDEMVKSINAGMMSQLPSNLIINSNKNINMQTKSSSSVLSISNGGKKLKLTNNQPTNPSSDSNNKNNNNYNNNNNTSSSNGNSSGVEVKSNFSLKLKLTSVNNKTTIPNEAASPTLSLRIPSAKVTLVSNNNNISVPPTTQTDISAAAVSSARKINKFLKTVIKTCLTKVKDHYMIAAGTGIKVFTAYPFLKSVDNNKFPDYVQIVTNPMDIARMEKRLNCDSYFDLVSVLNDVELIKANAYLYNNGLEGLEVRIMADALVNYFKYLLKMSLQVLLFSGDTMLINSIISQEISTRLNLSYLDNFTKDVTDYLQIINQTSDQLINKQFLLSLTNSKDAALAINKVNEPIVVNNNNNIKKKTLSNSASAGGNNNKNKSGSSKNNKNNNRNAPKSKVSFRNEYEDDLLNLDDGNDYIDESYENNQIYEYTEPVYEVKNEILDPVAYAREKSDWEIDADNIIRLIYKHPFVDPSKSTAIADFMTPVIISYPSIAEEYSKVIKNPMDLVTLINMFENYEIKNAEEFFSLLVSIFENVVTYNRLHGDSEYGMQMVKRCELLVEYTKWVCLEMLPVVVVDQEDNNLSPICFLTTKNRDDYRKRREDILKSAKIESLNPTPYTECKKLMKDIERCKNVLERNQLTYFIYPVNDLTSDYSVLIRDPIDLSTIKYKIDGSLPGNQRICDLINKQASRYSYFGEIISDLRRVFANAIKYNKQYLTTDTTNVSKMVYDAAEALGTKVDDLLTMFTINLSDRVERYRIAIEEIELKEAEFRIKLEKEEEEARQFELVALEKLKAEDPLFAADYDIEKKKRETEIQRQLHKHMQLKKSLLLSAGGDSNNLDDLVNDDLSDDANQSPENSESTNIFKNPQYIENNNLALSAPLLYGFGVAGVVPNRFIELIHEKINIRKRAWDCWSAVNIIIPNDKRNIHQSQSNVSLKSIIHDDKNSNVKKISKLSNEHIDIHKVVNIVDQSEEKEKIKTQVSDVNDINIVAEASVNQNKICFLFKEVTLKKKKTKNIRLDIFNSSVQED